MARDQMIAARDLIQQGQYSKARAILKTVDHPKAREWLDKIDELELAQDLGDPFAPIQLQTNTQVVSPRLSGYSNQLDPSRLLQSCILVFTEQNWNVKVQMPEMVQLEKRRSVSNWAAALLIVFLGLLGSLIVIASIASAKMGTITLQVQDSATIRVTGKNGFKVVRDPQELDSLANSVKNGATYAGALIFGIITTAIIWFLLFQPTTYRYY